MCKRVELSWPPESEPGVRQMRVSLGRPIFAFRLALQKIDKYFQEMVGGRDGMVQTECFHYNNNHLRLVKGVRRYGDRKGTILIPML